MFFPSSRAPRDLPSFPTRRSSDLPKAPFSALAFKVMSDPFVGKLTYFRVYSGTLKAGDRVLNTTTGKTERISRILQMHRSEEHTSELQSRRDLVCRLLLEKKKNHV